MKEGIWSFLTSSGVLLDVSRLLFTDRLTKTLHVSVDQKIRLSICFKLCGRAFETLSWALDTLGRAFESQEKIKCLPESWKSSADCLESSAECFCYNTAHAVSVSHGIDKHLIVFRRCSTGFWIHHCHCTYLLENLPTKQEFYLASSHCTENEAFHFGFLQ